MAFVGGLAATRLHLKCRPRTAGPFDGRTGLVFDPRTGPRTLRNAAANVVAVTAYSAA